MGSAAGCFAEEHCFQQAADRESGAKPELSRSGKRKRTPSPLLKGKALRSGAGSGGQ